MANKTDTLPRIPPKHLKDGCYARADALEAHLNAAKAENERLRERCEEFSANLTIAERQVTEARMALEAGPLELLNPPTLVALIEYLARAMYASVLPPTRGVFLQGLFAVCRLMVKSGIGAELLTRPQLQELGMLSRDPPPGEKCEHNIPRRFCTALHAPPSHSEVAASVNAAIDSMT